MTSIFKLLYLLLVTFLQLNDFLQQRKIHFESPKLENLSTKNYKAAAEFELSSKCPLFGGLTVIILLKDLPIGQAVNY